MDEVTLLILTVVGIVLFFLILREFWCWYWKINERNHLLREIRDELKRMKMPDNMSSSPNQGNKSVIAQKKYYDSWSCPSCYEENPNSSSVCSCGYRKTTTGNRDLNDPYDTPTGWVCPTCGVENDSHAESCNCGGSRPANFGYKR